MNPDNKELAVSALRNGTVIDHIPTSALFRAVSLLGLEHSESAVTIGNNLESARMGRKGIIKVADTFFTPEVLSRIALIAPGADVSIIRDYKVAEKHRVQLPDEIVDIVRCDNPKCITRHEPMPTRFKVIGTDPIRLCCRYCEREIESSDITLK